MRGMPQARANHSFPAFNTSVWDHGVVKQLARNEGMKKKMESTIMSYIETTMRNHSFIF